LKNNQNFVDVGRIGWLVVVCHVRIYILLAIKVYSYLNAISNCIMYGMYIHVSCIHIQIKNKQEPPHLVISFTFVIHIPD